MHMHQALWPASDRLRDLAFHALEEGLEVARTVAHAFTPFLRALDAGGRWLHFGLGAEDTEGALALADDIINDPRRGVEAYAIALDCELEVGGERTEGVRVEAGERGGGGGLVLVQRYVRRAGASLLERLGRPELWDAPATTRFTPVPAAFSRCGFSEAEWRAFHEAPRRAFLCVATADGPVRPRAREAFRRVLSRHLDSRSPLVGRVCGEALRLDALHGEPGRECPAEAPPDLAPLGPLCARVAHRLGLGEAQRFQRCLLDVGWRVARASSGVRGLLGGVRREERRALEGLAAALGLPGR
jgi:hypothetical protein